ncbi:MAG: hypothetical protein WCI61_07005 [Chloroflexota bacterium]
MPRTPYDIGIGNMKSSARLPGSTTDVTGHFEATFVMPEMGGFPECMGMSLKAPGVADPGVRIAYDFLYTGVASFPSYRCEALPDVPNPITEGIWRYVPLSGAPASPKLGERVTLRGKFEEGQTYLPRKVTVGTLYLGQSSDGEDLGDNLDLSANGDVTYSFTLTSRPGWSGRCVVVTVAATSVQHEAAFVGTARFNYP